MGEPGRSGSIWITRPGANVATNRFCIVGFGWVAIEKVDFDDADEKDGRRRKKKRVG